MCHDRSIRIFFFLMIGPPPSSPLFPYTPLSRSLDARHVGQLGVDQDHVRFGGACAFEPVLARALLEHGVPAALQQHSEPARRLFAVPGEKHEWRSEEHTSELQSRSDLVCRLLLE